MKKVLILNGDSFVGVQVAKAFYHSKEYDVEVTLTCRDDDTALKVNMKDTPSSAGAHQSPIVKQEPLSIKELLAQEEPRDEGKSDTNTGAASSPELPIRKSSLSSPSLHKANKQGAAAAPNKELNKEIAVPAALFPYVKSIVPSHNSDPNQFCRRLLEQDVVIAVLEDDSYEAECAIKVLLGSHYEVEKTFVLISSVMTWSYTLPSERSRARAEKREELERERLAFIEENGEEEELPLYLREETIAKQFGTEMDDAEAQELVPMRVFSEGDYATRVPHPRYQQWKMIEHLTKHANSESLHTYVLFAGLPYGQGEGELQSYFRDAAHQSRLPLYGPGENHIPMIHVDDLAAIAFKVGNSYDVLEDRYIFAVDRGNITQRQLLECLSRTLGGVIDAVGPVTASPYLREKYKDWKPLYIDSQTTEAGSQAVDMVNVQTASLPPPPPMTEIEKAYRNAPGNLFPFLVSDMMADPEVALQLHPEEDWVAIDGFVENIEKVRQQYTVVRQQQPFRAVVSGPPLSGKELVAEQLSQLYQVPHLTIPHIVKAYETHAGAVRAELHGLLCRRLQRRRDRAHARRRRAAEESKQEEKRLKAERRRQENGGEDKEDDDDDDEDDDEEEEDELEEGEETTHGLDDAGSDISGISDMYEGDVHSKTVEEIVNERYILGELEEGEGAGEEAIDEEMEEEDMDEALLGDDEDDEEEAEEGGAPRLTKAHRFARKIIQEVDLKERIRIEELRKEYKLAILALSNKFEDGKFPRIKEEVDEEEEDLPVEKARKSKNLTENGKKKKKANDASDDEEGDEGDEEEDEEGENEKAEGEGDEDEEENEGDDEDGFNDEQDPSMVPTASSPEDYLDEALAFFTRWRIRQPDCANRGYVLDSFPQTVRQALLLFHADSDTDVELRGKRVLPASDPEQVLPPVDAEFPLVKWEMMSNEEREAFEIEYHSDHRPLVTFGEGTGEEGSEVLTPVEESIFPDHVILLSDSDKVLQTRAGVLLSKYKEELDKRNTAVMRGIKGPSGGVHVRQAGATREEGKLIYGGKEFISYSDAEEQNNSIEGKVTVTASGNSRPGTSARPGTSRSGTSRPGTSRPGTSSSPPRQEQQHQFPVALENFYERLQHYKAHHNLNGSPNESLAVWFQLAVTTSVRGATSFLPPIRYENPDLADSEDDEAHNGAGGGGEDEEDEGGSASKPRTAKVLLRAAPTRDSATVHAEVEKIEVIARAQIAAAERQFSFRPLGTVEERYFNAFRDGDNIYSQLFHLDVLRAPLFMRQVGVHKRFPIVLILPETGDGESAKSTLLALQQMVLSMITSKSLPRLSWYGPVLTKELLPTTNADSSKGKDNAPEAVDEKKLLQKLLELEKSYQEVAKEEETQEILQERRFLRKQQVDEKVHDARHVQEMPMETYLMDYVVPSITPLMAEVTRLRPDDPVTVLSDLLYNYRRQTSL